MRGVILDVVRDNLLRQRSSNRLWPHAEAIKAACCMTGAAPDGATGLCDDIWAALFGAVLDQPLTSGWIDHFQDKTPLVVYISNISPYHLHHANATRQAQRGDPA